MGCLYIPTDNCFLSFSASEMSYEITLSVISGFILCFIVVAVLYWLYKKCKKHKQPSSVNGQLHSVSYDSKQEYTAINCLGADGENGNGGFETEERDSDINGSICHNEQSLSE